MKYFTKLTALLLALVLCVSLLPMSVPAAERSAAVQTEAEDEQEPTVIDSGTCGEDGDNVIWTLTSDGVLTFSGVGKISRKGYNQNGDYGYYPWKNHHAQVKKVVVESGVTSLCNGICDAHNYPEAPLYPNLVEVEIAGTVSKLGSSAFGDCPALKTVTLHEGLKEISAWAFEQCFSLEKIELPKSVKFIRDHAFRNCSSLEKIEIPKSVSKIGSYAFVNCTALKEVCYLGTPEQWSQIDILHGNYYLRRAASYNLPLCHISTKYTNYTYTGSAVKPVVTVRTLNDVKLKEGKNYTVSYQNNEDYGTGTITITGIGKYSGTTTRTFQIRPAKVKNLTMERYETYADLSWTANPDATSYRIYKSGVLQGQTTKTHYRLTDLTAKTNRTVTVKAVVKRTNAETGETETFLGMAASLKVKPIS